MNRQVNQRAAALVILAMLFLAACAPVMPAAPAESGETMPPTPAATEPAATEPAATEPAPTEPAPAAPFPVVETDTLFVQAQETVPIYAGPGSDYAVVGRVEGGMMARVTGASPDAAWWRVICPDDSVGDCWVSADPSLTQPTRDEPMIGVGGAPAQTEPDSPTGDAVVEAVTVQILESDPVQVQVVVTGYLPDPCTTITGVEAAQEGDTFHIRMTTEHPTDALCAQIIVPFEEVVTLDTAELAGGEYQVAAGDAAASFEFAGE